MLWVSMGEWVQREKEREGKGKGKVHRHMIALPHRDLVESALAGVGAYLVKFIQLYVHCRHKLSYVYLRV